MLDRAVAINVNAVLLQVRPSADALYASPLEPWSAYLTGEQGRAPQPLYDPLAFAVEEAHRRGLELHAWINPFRVRPANGFPGGVLSESSVASRHPDWVREYGKLLWLDPGDPAARDHTLAVAADIVSRYDIDGIHIDDYFYPYRVRNSAGRLVEFPDDATYNRYGGGLSRADWRRANIDDLVSRLYRQTKQLKPHVKVGISPFGIWRPGNPPQVRGFDAYNEIFGDSRKWLREGWVDYLSPQLYWTIERSEVSFPALLAWWRSENAAGRHIWPGLYATKADSVRTAAAPTSRRAEPVWSPSEIEYQVRTVRGLTPDKASYPGVVLFSGTILRDGSTLADHLARTAFSEPAVIPASPWLAPSGAPTTLPAPLALTVRAVVEDRSAAKEAPAAVRLRITWNSAPEAVRYVVRWSEGSGASSTWRTVIVPVATTPGADITVPPGTVTLAVSAMDRIGRPGLATVVDIDAKP